MRGNGPPRKGTGKTMQIKRAHCLRVAQSLVHGVRLNLKAFASLSEAKQAIVLEPVYMAVLMMLAEAERWRDRARAVGRD